jgi:uncharacterized caspase-like protein
MKTTYLNKLCPLFVSIFLLALLLCDAHAQTSGPTNFVALIIGNSSYKSVAQLPGADNDATDMAKVFSDLGFTIVNKTQLTNLTKAQMDKYVEIFVKNIRSGTVAVLYFSGHGVEIRQENYLVPVDAHIEGPKDIEQLVGLGTILTHMQRREAWNRIVILDACRDAPPVFLSKSVADSLGSSVPLVKIKSLQQGTRIVYAAEPGQKAYPAPKKARNSIFTAALLEAIRNYADASFDEIINRAGQITRKNTRDLQQPSFTGNAGLSFYPKTKLRAAADIPQLIPAPESTAVDVCAVFDCTK